MEAAKQSIRLHGLDLLKVIFAIMIVARHCSILSMVPAPGTELSFEPFALLNFSYWNLQNLAVPSFMMISLWFFALKRSEKPEYFKKRLARLTEIILFWWVIYALVGTFTSYALFPKTIDGYLGIPLIDGAMYFLGSMLIQIFVIELLVRILERSKPAYEMPILIVSLILGFAVSIYARAALYSAPGIIGLIAQHGPIIFFGYGPAALILARRKEGTALLSIGLVSLVALAALFLHQLSPSEIAKLPFLSFVKLWYGHPLAVFIACLIVSLAKRIKRENGPLVRALSPWVLGIYLVHPIVVVFLQPLLGKLAFGKTVAGGGAFMINWLYFISVMIVSLIIIWLLSKTPLRKFIA